MARVPVFDNHVHLRPDGHHVEAAKAYEKAGGTHFMLVHSPHDDFVGDTPDWERAYDRTVATAEAVRKETGVQCWVALGPYPVHLVRMAETLGVERGVQQLIKGAETAARYVEEGKAVAIGEVGRPHFEVSDEVWDASNVALEEILGIARGAGCPAILHTESADPEVMADLGAIADRAKMPRDRVIKHYAPPLVKPEECHGLFPSIIASRKHIRKAAADAPGGRWFLETDYIDDLSRPDVVMPVDTVPRRVSGFLQSGDLGEEMLWKSGVEWVERLYGVHPEL
ncbi:MAG: TatD family hydrolase [Euryarchaeota archaeon]|nr:TatD family hydrolase [Euryarchaeota archaeon]